MKATGIFTLGFATIAASAAVSTIKPNGAGTALEGQRCPKQSNCKEGVCYNDVCIINPRLSPPPLMARHDAGDPICHNDAECAPGKCYSGICALPPKAHTLVAREEPVAVIARVNSGDPTCHNDAECAPGKCYSGICALPPM